MSHVEFELPYPPTINDYYKPRFARGGRFLGFRLGQVALDYRRDAAIAIRQWFGRPLRPLKCRLSLTVVFHPPDRRVRDCDNILKATKDALTHARVWEDDSYVDEDHVIRGDVFPGGKLEIRIERIE